MKVAELMTRDVVTVTPETSLKDAASLLSTRKISGVPVVDASGTVVGVFSEADILAKVSGERPRGGLLGWLLEADVALDDKIRARTVGEAMTAPAIAIAPKPARPRAPGANGRRVCEPSARGRGRQARGDRHAGRSRAGLHADRCRDREG